jgi:hypothetical protein
MTRFFLAYGLMVLGLLGASQYKGWSLLRVNQIKNVPKTVRDNPGAYRSIYSANPHYFGGK